MKLNGVHSVKLEDLRLSIATDRSHCSSFILKPICLINKSKYFYKRKYLDHSELKRDVVRIKVFYWKRGFRETQVDTVVTDRGKDKVAVDFNIVEGPPTLVSALDVVQTQPVLNERKSTAASCSAKGTPLNLLRLDTTVVLLQQSLWDKGYADAVVDTAITLDSAARTGAIQVTLDPKYKTTIGEILIEGEDKVSERTLRKSLTMTPGDVFRRAELLRSQRALYESNLFRRAAIEVPKQGDSSKIIVVTVQEAPLREARMSAGFNTVDFFQVEGRFTHYNFLGGAKRLELQGVAGNLLASSLNGKFIFRDLTDNVGSDRARYFAPTYNSEREPPEAVVPLACERARSRNFRASSQRAWYLCRPWTRSERNVHASDYRPRPGQRQLHVRAHAGRRRRCVLLRQLRSVRPGDALRASPAAATLSIHDYWFARSDQRSIRADSRSSREGGLRALRRLSRRLISATIARRLTRQFSARSASEAHIGGHIRLGWVKALASTSEAVGIGEESEAVLHPRKRFYLGGSRSVRGYGENQLGPRILTIPATTLRRGTEGCPEATPITECDPNTASLKDRDFEPRPLGGNVVIEGSAELRFPLFADNVLGAAFIDAGYLAQRVNPALPKSRAAADARVRRALPLAGWTDSRGLRYQSRPRGNASRRDRGCHQR